MAISAAALGIAVAGGVMDISQGNVNRDMTDKQLEAQKASLATERDQHNLDVARAQEEAAQATTEAMGAITASKIPTQQSSANQTATFNVTQQAFKAEADARRSVEMNEMNYSAALTDIESQQRQNKSTKTMERRGAAVGAATTYFALAGMPAGGDKSGAVKAKGGIDNPLELSGTPAGYNPNEPAWKSIFDFKGGA